MKILQLTNKPPWPDKDGGAIAMLNMTRGLSRLGHQVTVLSMNTLKHHTRAEEMPENLRKTAEFRFVEVPAGISPIRALANLLFSRQPYNAVRFISPNYRNTLVKLLRQQTFDIIQLEGLYLCPYIPDIRKNSHATIVYRAHNIEAEIWERSALLASGPKKWYVKSLATRIERFERAMINQYDLLVPITERDNHKLHELGNKKPSHVCPSGIDLDMIIPGRISPDYPSLFHIGSLEWAPNQEGLLWFLKNVWSRLSGKYPDLRFYVAGRHAPAWLIARLDQPGIVFLGEVENAFDFMRSKAVMVVPLLSGSGMRVKIIEGMALAKAIVSTSIGAEGLSVTPGRDILIADDPDDFTRNLETVITDKPLCETIGHQAARFVRENFDNTAITGKLTAFYQKHIS